PDLFEPRSLVPQILRLSPQLTDPLLVSGALNVDPLKVRLELDDLGVEVLRAQASLLEQLPLAFGASQLGGSPSQNRVVVVVVANRGDLTVKPGQLAASRHRETSGAQQPLPLGELGFEHGCLAQRALSLR